MFTHSDGHDGAVVRWHVSRLQVVSSSPARGGFFHEKKELAVLVVSRISSTKNRRGELWGSRLVSQLEYLWASTYYMESHCTAVHLSVMLNSEVTFLLFFFFHSTFSIFLACSLVSSYRLKFLIEVIACLLFLYTITLTA